VLKLENNKILEILKKFIPEERIKQNESMKKHTSFKIGGPAEFFIKVNSIEEIQKLLKFSKENEIPLIVVGNGSNLLVLDEGIKGIVIKLELKEIEIQQEDKERIKITVGSGVPLGLLAQKLLKEEISGFEELSGIPGTIGGAIIMNAGAHGKEMKDIVTEVTVMDYNGKIQKFTNEQSKFEYRHSRFSNSEYIILQSKLLLQRGSSDQIKEKMDEYAKYRKEKQPIEYPSAGSTFKRIETKPTAKIIDECGLKGFSVGDAEVSTKHAGFIVNKGKASAKDVLELISHIKKEVKKKFNVDIELEILVLGDEK